MGTNPMQKMKRNSTLTGVIIGLMIGLILCVALYMFLTKNGGNLLLSKNNEERVKVKVLNQDVVSGQTITLGMFEEKEVLKSMVPSNYVDDLAIVNLQVQDEFGNILMTNKDGQLYMNIQDNADYQKTNDNFVLIGKESDGRYYKTRLSTNQKEYIKIINVPLVAKINMKMNSILTVDALSRSNEIVKDDLRKQEYSMIVLPSDVNIGDYIDIRLQVPNGGDYIVISKKRVVDCNSNSVWLNMYEEEIDLMSNAIIEYYIMPGSKLYATKYNEPGMQTAAIGTYVPNAAVSNLITHNPNIKENINTERYSEALRNIRNQDINAALAPYYIDPDGDGKTEALDNIEKNMDDEIKKIKEAREAYFGSLNAVN